jgi:para-nitrobenzyl esterase
MKVSFHYSAAAIAAAILTPLVAQIVEKRIPGDPVAIDSGLVAGKVLPSGVKAYFGVPFAAPPVRENRWREPQPVVAWKGTYNADRKMPECIQVLRAHNINHYFGEEATSEDCLYLNLWAPANAKAGANLPVIVFIYGGGSTIGSSGMALYGGEGVAKRGAIFVNFNYRLGALGFLAHPELTAESVHRQSGNYAYLDQVAALQWIRRNIAKFGGDPAEVVISGQSAGAGSVSLLQNSPLAKGLFRGVVAMSGGSWGNGGQMGDLATAEKTGVQVQQALKAKSLDDMRQMPSDRILALQEDCQLGCSGSIRIGGGNVDGYFLPKAPAQIFAAHEQNDVPAIVGFTHDESSNALRTAKNLEEYKAAAGQLYGNDADAFLKLYPASTDDEARAMGSAAARESAIEGTQRKWAVAQAKYGKAPVYVFMYSRVHPYIPGVVIADQNTATIGAYHTSDVPYWFGSQDALNIIRPTRNWTAYDRDLSNKMTDVLIAFARTGDPNTAAVHWPQWLPQNEQLVEFGDKIAVQPMNTARLDFMASRSGGGRGAPGGSGGRGATSGAPPPRARD